MTPSVIRPTIQSSAERRVFDLFGRSAVRGDDEATCFHSLNISQHDYKIVGELDFVLLSTRGVLVFEVKGGRVDCHEGVWTFTDRFGVEHRRSEGPFQQARSGMFSLRQRLERQFGRNIVRQLSWGYAVVFPDIDFPVRSVEWDDPMVLDAAALRGQADLSASLESLYTYWAEKQSHDGVISRTRVREIAQFLRPEFERIPSLRHRADQLDVAMEHLTAEQYEQLDLIDENRRILCAGGAGTGKTFVAVELARREAANGSRVLFVTSTPVLAAFVRSRLATSSVVTASMDQLPDGVFDALIIDEGQDILNLEDLAELDDRLEGGLENGRWRVFYDINRQSGLVGRFDVEALELLKGYGGVSARLSKNCRNTHEIVLQTKLLTASDLGTASAGHGPPVEFALYESREEQVALIDAHLNSLQEDDVPSGEITILSPLPLGESAASASRPARRRRLIELDEAAATTWPVSKTTFAQVRDFKGLENRFVLLVDIDHLDDNSRDINTIYVAMSRARAGLWVAMHRSLEERATTLARANLSDVMEDARLADD